MFDWLYGPRFSKQTPTSIFTVRNLTLDIETLFDLANEIGHMVKRSGIVSDGIPPAEHEGKTLVTGSRAQYMLRDRPVTEDDVRSMDVPDRNQLMLTVITEVWGEPKDASSEVIRGTTMYVDARTGQVYSSGPHDGYWSRRIPEEIATYLYAHGTQRPDWRSLRWLAWLTPIPIAVIAWIWLALTVALPSPVHLLILAVLALASFSAVSRAALAIRAQRQNVMGRSIRFRGESRERTQQRRADARQNVKVAFITAPVAIGVGIAGTLFAAFAGEWFK
ncbi:hypothetical protein [Microbacterium sp. K24]|uniref:hypothetical protein n=1 Tax=Microbacterium sp. K24 TaxID=2305446 RepID=UPI00109CC7BB|nr:hypothetical protein [Microbacterium sp. K24]